MAAHHFIEFSSVFLFVWFVVMIGLVMDSLFHAVLETPDSLFQRLKTFNDFIEKFVLLIDDHFAIAKPLHGIYLSF